MDHDGAGINLDREKAKENPCCLTLENLSKSFAGLEAVSHVNLKVSKGERRGIIGPNGAGKTTLFNLIAGDLAPTEGKIFFFGKEINDLPAHRRAYQGISRTFQITKLFPKLTVMDNLVLAAMALKKIKYDMVRSITSFNQLYQEADDVLAKVEMTEKSKVVVKNLSHGEQRQIEIAMALLGNPYLLLLDEPMAGLAPAESSMMLALLKALDKTLTILIIEHDMDVAFELSDRITVLNLGRVLTEGTKEEIQSSQAVQKIYLGGR